MTPLKLIILEQSEQLHDVKMMFHSDPKDGRQSENGRKASRNYILDQS